MPNSFKISKNKAHVSQPLLNNLYTGVHVLEADEEGGFGKKVSIYVDEDLSTYLKEKSLSEVLDSN